MIVADLITELEKLPPDALVVVDDFYGGFNDIHSVRVRDLVLDANPMSVGGEHQCALKCSTDQPSIVAVTLNAYVSLEEFRGE